MSQCFTSPNYWQYNLQQAWKPAPVGGLLQSWFLTKHQSSNLDLRMAQSDHRLWFLAVGGPTSTPPPARKVELQDIFHHLSHQKKNERRSHWCGESNKKQQFSMAITSLNPHEITFVIFRCVYHPKTLINHHFWHDSKLHQTIFNPSFSHKTSLFSREKRRPLSMARHGCPPWRRGSGTRPPRSARRLRGWSRWWPYRPWTAPVAGGWMGNWG